MTSGLQHDHEQAGGDRGNRVGTGLPSTDVDSLRAKGDGASALGGRSRAGSATRGDQTAVGVVSASSTDGAHGRRLSGAGGGSGGLGSGGSTGETTRAAVLVVQLVVAVHGPSQTLLGIAHGVGTVLAGGGIARDTDHSALDTTQVAEGIGHLLGGDAVNGHTLQLVVHAGAQISVRRGGQNTGGQPVGGIDGRAAAANGGADGVAGAVDTGRVDLLHLGREVVKVCQSLDFVAAGGDQTELVGGLEVHVDNTTAPDVVHLGAEQDGHVSEFTGTGLVAAVLGEEGGNRVVSELVSAVLVAGSGVARVTTPLVNVVTEEVDRVLGGVANQVVGDLLTDGSIVIGSVTNGQGAAVVLLLDVGLHITDGGLDVGHGVGVVDPVGDLVTGEETDDVRVLGESIDDIGVASEEVGVPGRVVGLDGLRGGGQIRDDIDTGVGKGVHALIVGGVGRDSVSADDVGAKLGQVWDVTLAALDVGQRVEIVDAGAAGAAGRAGVVGLVGDTADEELGTVVGVEELLALDLNGRESSDGRAHKGQASENGVLHDERESSEASDVKN